MSKYDSVHGRFKGIIEVKDGKLIVNGKPVTIFGERDPAAIQWSSAGDEYLVESTVRPSFPSYLDQLTLIAVFRPLGCFDHYREVNSNTSCPIILLIDRQCYKA
jgi:hypothetical protein